MEIDDIKTEFQKWLKTLGFQDKTEKGRPSTIYEYCKRIDRLCDKLYNDHSLKAWENLSANIGSVLISCYESCNKEYYIDKYNIKDALPYFEDIANISIDSNAFQATINLVDNGKEYLISDSTLCRIKNYLRIFDFCLEQNTISTNIDDILFLYSLYNEGSLDLVRKFVAVCSESPEKSFLDTSIHIQYSTQDAKKLKLALQKYYEFLQTMLDTPIIVKLKEERDDNKIKLYIAEVESVSDDLMKCLTTIKKTGKTALQIKSHYANGYLPKLEVASVLEIDHKTLDTLNKNGILTPNKVKGFYDEQDINEYLEKHFHKANYPNVDYSQAEEDNWCNRKDAAEIMNCTERTIYNYTKKGLLTYTNYAPQAPRYYKPELKYLATHK